jgi:hypothetical protein
VGFPPAPDNFQTDLVVSPYALPDPQDFDYHLFNLTIIGTFSGDIILMEEVCNPIQMDVLLYNMIKYSLGCI